MNAPDGSTFTIAMQTGWAMGSLIARLAVWTFLIPGVIELALSIEAMFGGSADAQGVG